MSDISKIIGVDIATIAKINNIAIGGIGSIGGADITSGFTPSGSPTCWYSADSLSLSNNDKVASWTDLSGNANHLLQAVDANRPVFKTGIQNGLPAVLFTSGDVSRLVANIADQSQPNTIFMVWKFVDTDNSILMDGIGAGDRQAFYVGADGKLSIYSGAFLLGPYANTDAHYGVALFNGANSFVNQDGIVSSGEAGAHALTGITIGADYTGTGLSADAYIMEIIVYDGNEDPTANLLGLSTKYNISENAFASFTGDDFSGTNGDAVNSIYWDTVENTLGNSSIQSNKLNLSPGGAQLELGHYQSKFVLMGDFDIQIDVVAGAGTPANYSFIGQMYISDETDYSNKWGGISYYFNAGNWIFGKNDSDTGYSEQVESAIPTKIRLTRIGETVRGYYWESAAWRWGVAVVETANDLYVKLLSQIPSGTTQICDLDNFVINSGLPLDPA